MVTISSNSEHSQTVTGSLDNSNKNCIFKRRGGSGMLAGMWQGVSGSAGGKDANDASDELEHRAVKVLVTMVTASDKLKEVWDLRQQLSQAYAKDLDKIPPHYTSKLRAKFEKFFNRWGQGFVITGYYGGEVRIRIKTDTEESFDGSGLSGAADSRGAVGGRSVPYHATMSGGASSLESAATRNTNQQADFCGGDPGNLSPAFLRQDTENRTGIDFCGCFYACGGSVLLSSCPCLFTYLGFFTPRGSCLFTSLCTLYNRQRERQLLPFYHTFRQEGKEFPIFSVICCLRGEGRDQIFSFLDDLYLISERQEGEVFPIFYEIPEKLSFLVFFGNLASIKGKGKLQEVSVHT